MPVYLYQAILPDGTDGDIFEVEQPMSAPALTCHPQTGLPVKRIYSAPNLSLRYSEQSVNNRLSPKKVEQAGFTRYERDKLTGTYHKTLGRDTRAPDVFKP